MINYSLLGYAIASSLILIICWAIYRILFEAKINPAVNRKVLLAIYALADLIPFISPLIQVSQPERTIEIGMLSLTEIPNQTSEIAFQNSVSLAILPIVGKFYLAGIMIMLIITCISIYKLLRLKKNAGKVKINGVDVFVHDNKNLASFSWFTTIFLYKNALTQDTQILLEHEKAHVNACHWLDLLISQVFLIMQWFNPVAWIMRKELQQVHEYQADEKVLEKGYDEKAYQLILLRNITNVHYPCFSNGFNNCSIKKRILMMMNRKNFKTQWWLRGTVFLAAAALGGTLLHVPAVAEVIERKEQSQDNSNISVIGVGSMKKEDSPVVINEETIGDAMILIDGREVPYEELKKINPDLIESITVLKNPDKLVITLKESYKQNYNVVTKVSNIDNIKSPFYEGGEERLSRDLAMRLRYPYEAYKDNIQGTVIVQFTVTKTGGLKDFRIEKSVNTDLDIAAVNAIKDLPGRWTPGEIDGVKSDWAIPCLYPLKFSKMKSSSCLSICVLLALLLSCNKTVIIEQPDYDTNGGDSDISFSIDRIELTDNATILDMSFYHFPGYWVRIDSDTKLIGVNTGKVYSLFKIKGMQPDTTEWMQKEAFRNARLYFEPIDPHDREVDFIESDEWTVKGIKLYDNTKGKIKTNISGTLDYFGGSWLRIIETGDNFKYGKTYIVPVRDGKFNYDIYTDYPRLFNVMIGKEYRSGSMTVANFWSEGDNVRLEYPVGNNRNFTIKGGQLTVEHNEFIKKREEEADKIHKGYYSKINELEKKGLLKTKRYMDLEYRLENEAVGRERENILDTIMLLNQLNQVYTPEGEKLLSEITQYYEAHRDSISEEGIKFYIGVLEKPSMVNLGIIYQEIRDGDIRHKKEILKLFQDNYRDFHPEHPYHKYLTEISRIYDNQ